jgi:AraC family transcriptional regulator of adaptative response/methylated-DNA-[protein]-cysteine methyltransferase
MMFDLPSPDTLYAALLARDESWHGRAFVGVATTGIFCRLTCPAPKPRPENCRFYASPSECLEAGFRPCKRCHPLGDDPLVARLMAALEAEPGRRWREGDLTLMGLDASTVRRAFKRATGTTFLEIARQRRLAAGLGTLSAGEGVTFAQVDAGFESARAFRAAFARLTGRAPGSFPKAALLRADWVATPLGPMLAVADARALHLLEFMERKALPRQLDRLSAAAKGSLGFGRFAPHDRVEAELAAYFAGRSAVFTTPLTPLGTPFQRAVWDKLREIPPGQTRSYAALARTLGRPAATRAVAAANGANPIAILIPCHRVIGADGSLTGYGGGLWRKQRLIDTERQFISTGETA